MCSEKMIPTYTLDLDNRQHSVPSPEEICQQLEEAMEDFHLEMKLGGFSERWLKDLASLWFEKDDLKLGGLSSEPGEENSSSLPYRCYRCDKVVRDYLSLAKHVLVYHEEDCPKVLENTCEVCRKVCRSAAGLASHRRQRHCARTGPDLGTQRDRARAGDATGQGPNSRGTQRDKPRTGDRRHFSGTGPELGTGRVDNSAE